MALRKPETVYERALISIRMMKRDLEEIEKAHNKLFTPNKKGEDNATMYGNHMVEFEDKLKSDYTQFKAELKEIIGDN